MDIAAPLRWRPVPALCRPSQRSGRRDRSWDGTPMCAETPTLEWNQDVGRRRRMVKTLIWCCSIAVLAAAGCAPEQVRGSIDGPTGTETFAGTAHGSVVDKSGNLT